VIRGAHGALEETPAIVGRPAPFVEPVVDGEKVGLRCSYWIDQTASDQNAVAAEVERRVWAAIQAQRRSTGT
jgi:hypothetical protein